MSKRKRNLGAALIALMGAASITVTCTGCPSVPWKGKFSGEFEKTDEPTASDGATADDEPAPLPD